MRCVRDSNSSRNPFCTNILFNQVFKVQRLIQREEFAVLLSFDRLNWNNAKIVKNNNMTKFRYITHCFFEVFVLSWNRLTRFANRVNLFQERTNTSKKQWVIYRNLVILLFFTIFALFQFSLSKLSRTANSSRWIRRWTLKTWLNKILVQKGLRLEFESRTHRNKHWKSIVYKNNAQFYTH